MRRLFNCDHYIKKKFMGKTELITGVNCVKFWGVNLANTPKFSIHQLMHFLLILENSKIYIQTYIKIAPTCFGLRPSSGSLHLSLAKVTLTLKHSVKLRRYVLCGGVAACYVQVWRVCCVLCRARL
jgi:hypothetical protein